MRNNKNNKQPKVTLKNLGLATALSSGSFLLFSPLALAEMTSPSLKPGQYNPQAPTEVEAAILRGRLDMVEEDLVAEREKRREETFRNDVLQQKQTDQAAAIAALQAQVQAMASGAVPVVGTQTNVIATVQRGDTVHGLARRFDVPARKVIQANNFRKPYKLAIGQKVIIPGKPAQIQVAQRQPPQQRPQPNQNRPAQQQANNQPAQNQQSGQRVAQQSPSPQSGPRPTQQSQAQQGTPETVGAAPTQNVEPQIDLFSNVGGILTPDGVLLVEPQLTYSASSDNRFFFAGTDIARAVLIGVINATDTDRSSLTGSLGARYGLSDRFEIDLALPFVSRQDTISGVRTDDDSSIQRDLEASSLGDITGGLHYQINNAGGKWPYMVANLRAKAPTGEGPFDVTRDDRGLETEATTGSGYWTVEPSLTFIKRADPAVLFANIGYQANLKTEIDKIIGSTFYEEIDPGDAIRTSFGIGLSLNDNVSLNFGYDQSYVFGSEFLVRPIDDDDIQLDQIRLKGQDITIGQFLFGLAYNPGGKTRVSINTGIGVTDEAPDVSITLKLQRSFLGEEN